MRLGIFFGFVFCAISLSGVGESRAYDCLCNCRTPSGDVCKVKVPGCFPKIGGGACSGPVDGCTYNCGGRFSFSARRPQYSH
jgi:hypothetical protein